MIESFFFLTQGPREFITINYSKFSGLGLPLNRTHDIIVHIIIIMIAPSNSTEVVNGFKSKLDSIAVSLFGNMKVKMRTANNIRRQNPNNFSDTEARASSMQSSLSSQFTFGLLLIRTKTRMTASSIRTGTKELPFEKDKHAFG